MRPLIVITGPTASGKTSLAIKIAKKYNGEIISADSRAIYEGADIGTAKPTKEEQSNIPHWGIDLVKPGKYFSAADYKKYAQNKIKEIREKGHTPILVGGTGLYIDSILFDYRFGPKANKLFRFVLQHVSTGTLCHYCKKNNIIMPENNKNRRYIIRAIEKKGTKCSRLDKPIPNAIIVGITTDKTVLRDRIEERANNFFESGVVEEAKALGKKYGWNNEAMKSNAYPIARLYLRNKISIDEAKNRFITLDWRLAKRQLTWMKRNKFIHWVPLIDAEKFIDSQLAINE